MFVHCTWTELTRTDLQQVDLVTLVTRVSVTAWLAAAKPGRLVLSQFWTYAFEGGCSHWKKNVSPRTGVQFSLVHVLWTSLNNFPDSCVLEPAMATERSDVEKPSDKTVCDLLPLSAKRLRANHACKADKQQSADWAECQDHVRWTPFDLWRDQCRQKSRIVAAISVPVLQQHHYSRTCVCTVLT